MMGDLSSWETTPFNVQAGLQQHRQSWWAQALITVKLLHCSGKPGLWVGFFSDHLHQQKGGFVPPPPCATSIAQGAGPSRPAPSQIRSKNFSSVPAALCYSL